MRISILTLFPDMFKALDHSITGRAIASQKLMLNIVDIRHYSADKHQKCDDTPFGGGAGMVMTPQPIYDAVNAIDPDRKAFRIYMSPKGERLSTGLAKKLSNMDGLLILCGHYEGVDQRVLDMCFDCEISIGDYILTGGELAAMVLTDCISRFVPGVLGSSESVQEESFSNGLLEYPQYTRPQVFMNRSVPEVLLSGNHKRIAEWRAAKSLELTIERRSDLIGKGRES